MELWCGKWIMRIPRHVAEAVENFDPAFESHSLKVLSLACGIAAIQKARHYEMDLSLSAVTMVCLNQSVRHF